MNRHSDTNFIWNEVRNSNCTSCELHETTEHVCLLGDGPVPCDSMIVGEAPGGREEAIEIPFSGKAGMFLRQCLKEVGIDPREIYITNVVSCRPPGNRTPKTSEWKACSELYLWKQVDLVKPKVILLLGNTALAWALGRKGKITQAEGTTFKDSRHNSHDFTYGHIYVPSRHPSSVIRADGSPEYKYVVQKFKENLLLFKRILNPVEDDFKFIKRCPTLKELEGAHYLYVDIETNGLNPFKLDAKIHSMSLKAGRKIDSFDDEVEDTIQDRIIRINKKISEISPTYCFKFEERDLPLYKAIFTKYPIIAQRGTFEGTWIKQHIGV